MKNKSKKYKSQITPIQCVWGLLCTLSSTDQQTNNISLFNIIEQLTLPTAYFVKRKEEKKPIVFPYQYEIILYWRRILDIEISNEEIIADLKIKTINPKGKTLLETFSPLKFPVGKKNLRFRVTLPGVIADIPGDYINSVEIKFLNNKEFQKVLDIPFTISEK